MKNSQLNRKFSQNKSEKNISMFTKESTLKNTLILQHRLKKQINFKFNKNPRLQEINCTKKYEHSRRHNSLLASNPLTKSSFSLSDAITHKASLNNLEPIKKAVKHIMTSRKVLQLSQRQKYNSFDESIFQTRAPQDRTQKMIGQYVQSAKDIGKYPRDVFLKESLNLRNNKFRLLIKQNSHFKSVSQRKISRIDSKIKILQQKNTYLHSLIPPERAKAVSVKIQPKNYNIGQDQFRERITKMVRQLIKMIELYYNMYQHNNIVGGHLKNIEGFNKRIRQIVMTDELRAKRVNDPREITSLFKVFGDKQKRSQFFMQEDMSLFNTLNNYLFKIEKKYNETLSNYNYFENKKKKEEQEAFRKTREKYQKKLGRHEQINQINGFIQNRMRHDQGRREEYMQGLQKRGVTLSLIQRSRQLILRERESAVKNAIMPNPRK